MGKGCGFGKAKGGIERDRTSLQRRRLLAQGGESGIQLRESRGIKPGNDLRTGQGWQTKLRVRRRAVGRGAGKLIEGSGDGVPELRGDNASGLIDCFFYGDHICFGVLFFWFPFWKKLRGCGKGQDATGHMGIIISTV